MARWHTGCFTGLIVDVRIESRVEGGATVVTIGGRLVASTVRELLNLCESVEGVLVLDLSGLVFADARGLEALRELEERGAELRGASPFIRLLKNGDPTGDRPLRGP